MVQRLSIIFAVCFFGVAGAFAQAPLPVDTVRALTGVKIRTGVDSAEMYVGDFIKYTVGITYDSTIDLVPPPLGANLGGFEVKDYEPDIETKLPDGRIRSETVFTLSTYTTGDYIIPPVPVAFNMPDSTVKIMLSEAVPIKVLSLLENAGDSLDVKPLKDQYEFERDMTRYYVFGGIGLFVILAAIVALLYWRHRRRQRDVPDDLRDPWEIAFERLARLKERRFIEDGQFKVYYIELTELIREFMGRMYRVDVLEMTTEEFLAHFAAMDLSGATIEAIGEFLKHGDLVKFARFIPEPRRAEDDYLFAHDLIASERDDYQRRQAALAAETQSGAARPLEPAGGAHG